MAEREEGGGVNVPRPQNAAAMVETHTHTRRRGGQHHRRRLGWKIKTIFAPKMLNFCLFIFIVSYLLTNNLCEQTVIVFISLSLSLPHSPISIPILTKLLND